MSAARLSGVIAAVATPIDESGAPDLKRAVNLARYLLDNGCDGLNVLGTTGEATSFSLDERKAVMDAYKANGLPLHRLMVGTGAAAVSDAVALTRHAAELGFGGALVLPPFYYKGVPDDGLIAYVDTLVKATENVNADLCGRAWGQGDTGALDAAVTIRKLFDGRALVSGVKALLAHIHGDAGLGRVRPPLAPFSAADRASVIAGHDAVRSRRVA